MRLLLYFFRLRISSNLSEKQWKLLILNFTIAIIFPSLSMGQPMNDLPCSATNLGELTLAGPLTLMNASNQGTEGENKGWYNHIINEESCKGRATWNNTVYFKFTLDKPITGVTVTVSPRGTGQLSAILLAAQECEALGEQNKSNWSPGPGSSCATQPGEVITIWDDCLVHPGGNDVESIHRVFDGVVYLMVSSDTDVQEGAFDIRIDAIPPTYCDSCLNGQETEVDGLPLPLVLQSDRPTDLCTGDSVKLSVQPVSNAITYYWRNLETGEVTESSNPSFIATTAGIYSVDVESDCTPYRSDTITVITTPELIIPTVSLQAESTFCQGDSLLLSVVANPELRYQWYRSGKLINRDAQLNQYWVYESGEYTLEIANTCQSVQTEAVSVTVHPVPEAPSVSESAVCVGETITLTAYSQGAASYHWYSENGKLLPNQSGPELVLSDVTETQNFQVTAFNHENCESSRVSIQAKVNPVPQASISADTTVISLGSQLLLSTPEEAGYAYQWSPAESLSDDKIANPLARPNDNTTYTLWVRTAEGYMSMDTLSIIVQKVLQVPNTFTPNEDGVNDTWQITNLERFPGNRLRVLNRWGQTILETTNYDQSWRGDFQGRPLPEDTYFYVIDKNNGDPALSGSISIIR